ncbi:MAG: NAD-dependent epimerase/dehydratase family protein [Bacteroidota bacterium]
MNKVFITGANGMLGSHICRALIQKGYSVKAMCLKGAPTTTINTLPIEVVFGDILDRDFLMASMKDCDYVIHVAAMTNVWPRRIPFLRKVNMEGTKNVMELVEALHIKRMVHVGSASSFDHGSMQAPGNEKCQYQGWQHGMDYLDSKYKAQEMLVKKHQETGFPVIIINPTFMIGAFDSGPSSGQLLINFSQGKLPGYSGGGKNFVCTKDVAAAAVNALVMGKLGDCYIAGNQNLSYKDFFRLCAKVLNKPFKLMLMPKFLVLFVGILSSIVARISGKKPKISYSIAKFAGLKQYFSAKKAQDELNMPQTPLETGIQEAVTWFKENGYI